MRKINVSYEDEEYIKCSKGMPNLGDKIISDGKTGQVVSVDILNRKYKLLIEDEIKEVKLEDEKNT